VNKIATFPQTTLGSAAGTVVANLDAARPIKWPPPRPADLPEDAVWAPKITRPGIYDMPIELYHSPDLCDGPSVSSSGALVVEQQSLLHFWDKYVNPEREPFDRSDSMTLGSAVHHLVLGEANFARKFAVRPKEFKDWRTNDAKAWRAAQIADGREVLVPDQLETIKAIASNLAKHPLVRDGLLSGLVEQSIIVKDAQTGLWLKSRIDVLALSASTLCDLKTCIDASDAGLNRTMGDREYQFQFGFGGIVYEQHFGRSPGNDDHVLVFCETKRPFPVVVRPVDIGAVAIGRMQARRALRKIAAAFESDDWPAYDSDLRTLYLPPWRAKQIEAEIKGGLLNEADAA